MDHRVTDFNSLADLHDFFSIGQRQLTISEFMEFWESMTPIEQEYYSKAPLD